MDDQQPVGALRDAYPWPPAGAWTRVAMLRALDGGVVGPDGRSRSISSQADRAVLSEIRRLSDAIVVGAGTVRAEPYGPLRPDPGDAETARQRVGAGLAGCPVLVIVTASLDLPWEEAMFGQSAVRPIVVSTDDVRTDDVRGADQQAALARAREHADVHLVPGPHIDVRHVVQFLHARGLRRLVCEGGPRLLSQFAAADLVDEVDLTLCPMMPTAGGVPLPPDPGVVAFNSPVRFELVNRFEIDSFLFVRYVRQGRAGDRPDP